MGVIGSKCRAKVNDTDVDDYVNYEKLRNDSDEEHLTRGNKRNVKETKERRERYERITTNKDSSSWEAVISDISHTSDCKHSKSLSLTTQVSPKSNATTDGDDVGSVSTLTSMLENPLLKRVKPDNPLFKRADGELRPVGPVNPWKLGKDKNQVRLELEEKGLLQSKKCENYAPKVDPKEEGIIGDLRSVGIISDSTANDNLILKSEFTRRLPTRLTHLPMEVATTQPKIPDQKHAFKLKIHAKPESSKSEVGTECTTVMLPTNEQVKQKEQENGAAFCSRSVEITDDKNENDVLELKIKMIDTEIL